MDRLLIDWQQCVLNLSRHRPLAKIAREIGAEPETLQRIARSETMEPRFTVGVRLLNMHLELEPDKHNHLIRDQSEYKLNRITK